MSIVHATGLPEQDGIPSQSVGVIGSTAVRLFAISLYIVFVLKLTSAISDLLYFKSLESPILLVPQLACFALFGAWLFWCPDSKPALTLTALFFVVLGGVAGYDAISGLADCGCLPGITLKPSTTTALDFIVASLLVLRWWTIPTNAVDQGPSTSEFVTALKGAIGFSVVAGITGLLWVGLLGGRSNFTPALQLPFKPVHGTPDTVSLDRVQAIIPLHNRGTSEIRILGIANGCGVQCRSQMPVVVPAGGTADVEFMLRWPTNSRSTVVGATLFSTESSGLRAGMRFTVHR